MAEHGRLYRGDKYLTDVMFTLDEVRGQGELSSLVTNIIMTMSNYTLKMKNGKCIDIDVNRFHFDSRGESDAGFVTSSTTYDCES